VVETIINSRKYTGVVKYRIRWRGYDELGPPWEEFERLDNSPEKVNDNEEKFPISHEMNETSDVQA